VVAVLAASCVVALTACSAGGSDLLSGEITLLSGTAESNAAPPATGDYVTRDGGAPPQGEQARSAQRWVGLRVGSAGSLDGVVTNGAGLTLYRFDRDSADPPTTNCAGDCAQTWPKVLLGDDSRLFVEGVDPSVVGTIPAGDGTYQVTIGGWPVYRFAEDTRAGQAKGQGVGGTWFAVAPDGRKAGGGTGGDARGNDGADDRGNDDGGNDRGENRGDEGGDNRGNDNRGNDGGNDDGDNRGNDGGGNDRGNGGGGNGGGANTATSITLFDEPGRSGSGAAQGVSNSRADANGCVAIPRAGQASSISASGSYTLYAGADCTGRSVRLNGDVDDLGGFDDTARSVRLAPPN
jgi:predicted lipoprotein with Yx(FWY)xxD motif